MTDQVRLPGKHESPYELSIEEFEDRGSARREEGHLNSRRQMEIILGTAVVAALVAVVGVREVQINQARSGGVEHTLTINSHSGDHSTMATNNGKKFTIVNSGEQGK